MFLPRLSVLLFLSLVACSATEPTDAGALDDAPGGLDAGSGEVLRCRPSCSVPADCVTSTAAAYDADNWSCDAGACAYLGCHDDAECGAGRRCADGPVGVPSCTATCATTADCDMVGGSFGPFACTGGLCLFTGCPSDAYCAAEVGPTAVCRPQPVGVAMCVTPCSTDAECADPDYPLPLACDVDGICRTARCEPGSSCPMAFGRAHACTPGL